jgi:hypothetical protein
MRTASSTRRRGESKTALQEALEARMSGEQGLSKQAMAQDAGVSIRTVQEVLSGDYAKDDPKTKKKRPSPDPKVCSPRQLRGYTEALTRLSRYAGIPAEETLPAYGISLDWKDIRTWMTRVERRQAVYRGISDPVLEAILTREEKKEDDGKEEGRVRAGVLMWPPFFEDNEDIVESWAWEYVSRLIGALNPLWAPKPESVADINEAVKGITEGKYDLVFGIYDTPYRRLLGLSFIHLPGLGVPLGALVGNGAQGIDWRTITHNKETSHIEALVIEEEVGHLFLAGACRYTKQDLVVSTESETASLAARFAHQLFLSSSSEIRPILVADNLTCSRVKRELQSGNDWKRKDILQGIDVAALTPQINKVNFVTDDKNSVTPVYRLGIAYRADAKRWGELLQAAQTEELFRNSLGLTAESYATLLAKAEDKLCPLSFEDISPLIRGRFVNLVNDRHNLKPDWKEKWDLRKGNENNSAAKPAVTPEEPSSFVE